MEASVESAEQGDLRQPTESDPNSASRDSGRRPEQQSPAGTPANRTGAAGSGNSNPQDIVDQTPGAEGDLEYSKSSTDLVLEHLRNQANNPDPKLLEQMNWTEQDLKDFLARWEEMKRKAQSGSDQDRKHYEDALRSLGLRPESVRRNILKSQRDKLNRLSEDGAVNRAPAELAEEFNSFLKNRNRVDKSK